MQNQQMALALDSMVASTNETQNRIGWLIWFKVSEDQTHEAVCQRAFIQSGLPKAYALPSIRPADAFRRASKSVEGRVSAPDQEDKVELLVRDVANTKDEIVRHLVVERRNVRDRRLDYAQCAAVLSFAHPNRDIDAFVAQSDDFVLKAVDTFRTNYRWFLSSYDGQAKRRTIRMVLNDLSAASVKESGGVYFIPRENEALLFSVVAFINELPHCKAYKMPVEDTSEARDMVKDVVTNKASVMLGEIRAALREDKLSDKDVKRLIEQSRQVRRDVVLYQSILKESIGSLETDVDLLEMQMMTLMEQL